MWSFLPWSCSLPGYGSVSRRLPREKARKRLGPSKEFCSALGALFLLGRFGWFLEELPEVNSVGVCQRYQGSEADVHQSTLDPRQMSHMKTRFLCGLLLGQFAKTSKLSKALTKLLLLSIDLSNQFGTLPNV